MPFQREILTNKRLQKLWRLLKDERGQDMIEYTLLIAFVALSGAAIYISAGKQVRGIWSQANSTLVLANGAGS